MKEKLRFLGLDVHAETIAMAITAPAANANGSLQTALSKLPRSSTLRSHAPPLSGQSR
jgi:hypothetical protein